MFVSTVLVGTWIFQPTRASWDQLDWATFRMLNATLAWGEPWQLCMAIANHRVFDAAVGIAFAGLIGWSCWSRQNPPRTELASLTAMVALFLATNFLVHDLFLSQVLQYHRRSPTYQVEECWRLSELVPAIDAKDTSWSSFPSDHGYVLFFVALYLGYRGPKRVVLLAWCVALAGSLPRLVGGAHWLTDFVIGGLPMAIMSVAVVMATPLHDSWVEFLEMRALIDRLPQRLSRRPASSPPESARTD